LNLVPIGLHSYIPRGRDLEPIPVRKLKKINSVIYHRIIISFMVEVEPNRLPSLLPPAVHSICMITPYMKGEQRVMGPDPAADPWIDEVGPPGWVKTGMSSTQGAEKDFEHFEKGGAEEDFFEGKSCCGKRVTSSAGLAAAAGETLMMTSDLGGEHLPVCVSELCGCPRY
jgi:hypothetical protein